MKRIIFPTILAALLAVVGLNAQQCNGDNDSYGQGHSMKEEQMSAGYNSPARYDVQGAWDYFINASFLYWQPRQKGVEVGTHIYPTTEGAVTVSNNSIVNMDFDYHPAFKVGLGMNSDRDDWSVYVEYIRFYSTDSRSKSIPTTPAISATNRLITPWVSMADSELGRYIKGKWKVKMNLLDVELARAYYVGTQLTFKPFVGARGGWLDQVYHADIITYYGSADYTGYAHNKSDSWLIGLRVGVDTNWLLGSGFRFFGNTAASIFYQKFKTSIKDVRTSTSTYKNHDKIGYINPNFECALGFGWGTYFSDNSWHFDLSAGYEFHIFWNQNMIRSLVDGVNTTIDGNAGDLMLHGVTLSAQFDF